MSEQEIGLDVAFHTFNQYRTLRQSGLDHDESVERIITSLSEPVAEFRGVIEKRIERALSKKLFSSGINTKVDSILRKHPNYWKRIEELNIIVRREAYGHKPGYRAIGGSWGRKYAGTQDIGKPTIWCRCCKKQRSRKNHLGYCERCFDKMGLK